MDYEKIIAVFLILLIIILVIFVVPAEETTLWNKVIYSVKKADDATNYDKIKQVEDTCRAMISNYKAYAMQYEMYKDSEDDFEIQMYANPAKIEANNIAVEYNNYILKNSFIWKENVPEDIKEFLEYVQ